MRKQLLRGIRDSGMSVLPILGIVLALHFTIAPMPIGTLVLFITGASLLTLGVGVFTLGAENSMLPMGEILGSRLTRSRKLWLLLLGGFSLGIAVTVAEPDLQVMTKQVPAVPDLVLVFSVAVGVGVFLVLALLRIVFQKKLSHLFILSYIAVFAAAAIAGADFMPIGFDSGGVTTGPITVPFILALGVGVSAVRVGPGAEEDSFGLCGICSVGPILAVLVMGMFFDASGAGHSFETPSEVQSAAQFFRLYGSGFLTFGREVAVALFPIAVLFALFQVFFLKLPKAQIIRLAAGLVYTFVGLTIFLTAANIGFMPAGRVIGQTLASLSYNWVLIPIAGLIGFFVVFVEPAVKVLNKQVEEITSGAISRRVMMMSMSVGVAIALMLAVIRLMTGAHIAFFLVPGYVIALALMFFVPNIFTAIAFDSGGVVSGAMAATFVMPFATGICVALGGNIMTDAFGIVAMIAMMPLITLQVVGLIYRLMTLNNERRMANAVKEGKNDARTQTGSA